MAGPIRNHSLDLDKIKENYNKLTSENDVNKAEDENKLFELNNKQKFSKHKHKLFICVLYILFSFVFLLFGARLLHFILPISCHWLDLEQIQSLDKFLYSGAIGGVLGKYGFKVMKED